VTAAVLRGGAGRGDTTGGGAGGLEQGVGQERVSAIQRSRLLAAMVEVAGERGAAHASVAHVVARAGISRRTFYELFEDRDDCFLAAFEHALARAREVVLPAYASGRTWRERIRAGLTALLCFFDEEPSLGAVLVVDALNAGPRVYERRERLISALIHVVGEGDGEGRVGGEHPQLVAEGVVGAVFSVVHARMLERRVRGSRRSVSDPPRGLQGTSSRAGSQSLVELVNPLMGMIVMPYLGAAAARRELARPVPRAHTTARSWTNPLRDLDMRLTYRTVRVLVAVGGSPGASNRRVAERAGVADQGQISKLLGRLERLGLIENTGEGPVKGEPNAWSLTARGAEVERVIRSETATSMDHEEETGR
jgi:AcrR family transcriptional regulator/DNA-binding MarR family transcriptional regulator